MVAFLISAVAFFLLLTFLVLIHEAGHFFAARRAGVTVEEFGFGLPPRLKTLFKRNGTRFSLNWIPFGGFVRLKGENAETEADRRAPGSFGRASIGARVVILTAGVAMNFLFAILIFVVGFSVGQWNPTYLSLEEAESAAARGEINLSVFIESVLGDGSAAEAGVPARSILRTVDGQPVKTSEDVPRLQQGKKEVTYGVLTGPEFTEEKTFTVPLKDGKSGIVLQPLLSSPRRGILRALLLSLREAKVMTVQTVLGMAKLFTSLASSGTVPEGITGIVGIAQLTLASVQQGLLVYLRLAALLSLSLAILNILPLPALDGGRLVFVLLEFIRRRPANRRFELTTNAVGFVLLILLIVIITYHDILRLF